MTALAAVLGGGFGLGLVLVVAGWRGRIAVRAGRFGWDRWRAEQATRRLAVAAAAAVAVGAATGWPVGAVLAGLAGWSLPALLAGGGDRAREVARIEAIAGWAEMLRDTMAGAAGLEQAISATAMVAPVPIRAEVVVLAARLERERLVPALRAFAEEVADPTCDLVVAALVLAAEHQARRLGELLGSLAAAAREQATMRLRVEAGRARTRTSIKVIVAATCILALGLAVLNRDYLSPYDSAVGQLVLAGVGGLFAVSFVWLARLARPAVPARLLAQPAEIGPAGVYPAGAGR